MEIVINNKKYFINKPSLTVLQACEQAFYMLPKFCFHEKLSIAGNCRMCLVELDKSPKPVASCALPISNGMVIFTDTPLVKKAREAILEFLLINHPLDCPICDQAGECDLQDITLNYGSDYSRIFEYKRSVEDKECGPIIKTIMTRCIHCTRCVRFLTELAGVENLGALKRGDSMEIGTFLNKHIFSEISGNLIDICPVGALTSKPYAFLARNWELKKINSIDYTDSLGSNIIVHTRTNNKNMDEILRILPQLNNNINESWISDKTRYSFDGIYLNRLINIIDNSSSQQQSITWSNNFFKDYYKKKLSLKCNLKKIIGSIGTISNVEEIFYFYSYLKFAGNSANLLLNNYIYIFNKDLPLFYQFNDKFLIIEKCDLILLIGVNPRLESAMLNLRIRKHFFNKEIVIGYINSFYNLTYPFIHLGTSTSNFLEIIEGKHFFCKKIRKSKKPLILVGSEFGLRVDGKILQNLLKFLLKKSFLNLKNFMGLNILHQNLTQTHICNLGLENSAQSYLYFLQKNSLFIKNIYKDSPLSLNNFHYTFKKDFIFFLNNIDYLKNNFLIKSSSKLEISLNTHYNYLTKTCNLILPIKSFYEQDNLILNTEGCLQKAYKIVSSNINIKNSKNFWLILLKNFEKKNSKIFNNWILKENPYLNNPKNFSHFLFLFNIFKLNEFQQKLYFVPFNQNLKNFYMTDNISQNSKTMAECSLFIKNKSNFL